MKPATQILVSAGPIPALIFLVTFGMTLFEAARVPTIEAAVCGSRASGSNNAGNCREDHDAQTRLASLNGWVECATAVQATLLMLPNTWLAQRMDKHTLLLIGFSTSIVSMTYFYAACYFAGKGVLPLNMVIFFHVFECVGGGIAVAYVLLNSLLAAQTTVETRASVFYVMGTVLILARAGGTAACGALLQLYPRAIGATAIVTYALNIPVILLWPRPVTTAPPKLRPEPEPLSESCAGLLTDVDGHVLNHNDETESDSDNGPKPAETSQPASVRDTTGIIGVIISWLIHILSSYQPLLIHPVYLWGLLFHALAIMGTDVQTIQPQWTVHRFRWTYAAVAYVNVYTAVVCLVVLVGLPFLSANLLRILQNPQMVEVAVLAVSLALRVIGTVAMGLAPTRGTFLVATAVQALSAGAYDTFKAFLTGFCPPTRVAELYAAITLVETATHVAVSRLWAHILIVSLGKGGGLLGMGLPFLVSTAFSTTALVLVRIMKGYERQVFHEEDAEVAV